MNVSDMPNSHLSIPHSIMPRTCLYQTSADKKAANRAKSKHHYERYKPNSQTHTIGTLSESIAGIKWPFKNAAGKNIRKIVTGEFPLSFPYDEIKYVYSAIVIFPPSSSELSATTATTPTSNEGTAIATAAQNPNER